MKRILLSITVASLFFVACSDADTGNPNGTTAQDIAASTDAGSETEDTTSWVPDIVDPGTTDVDEAPEKAPLQIFSISPDRGLASGLEQVEIVGEGFESTVQVYFGESLAQDTFVLDENRIAALTPPRVPGLVDVRLVNTDTGETAVLEAGYLFFNPVSIIEVDPANGHVLGGDAITIKGSGFIEGSVVLIGGKSAISAEVVDDNTILAVTPEAAEAGTADVHERSS